MRPRQPSLAVPMRRPNASHARAEARRGLEIALCETVWRWRHQTVSGLCTCSDSSRMRAIDFGSTAAMRLVRPAPSCTPTPDALPPPRPLPALLRPGRLQAGRRQRSAAAACVAVDASPSVLIARATWRPGAPHSADGGSTLAFRWATWRSGGRSPRGRERPPRRDRRRPNGALGHTRGARDGERPEGRSRRNWRCIRRRTAR